MNEKEYKFKALGIMTADGDLFPIKEFSMEDLSAEDFETGKVPELVSVSNGEISGTFRVKFKGDGWYEFQKAFIPNNWRKMHGMPMIKKIPRRKRWMFESHH